MDVTKPSYTHRVLSDNRDGSLSVRLGGAERVHGPPPCLKSIYPFAHQDFRVNTDAFPLALHELTPPAGLPRIVYLRGVAPRQLNSGHWWARCELDHQIVNVDGVSLRFQEYTYDLPYELLLSTTLQVFPATLDTNDHSHFTARFVADGRTGVIDGHLINDEAIRVKVSYDSKDH